MVDEVCVAGEKQYNYVCSEYKQNSYWDSYELLYTNIETKTRKEFKDLLTFCDCNYSYRYEGYIKIMQDKSEEYVLEQLKRRFNNLYNTFDEKTLDNMLSDVAGELLDTMYSCHENIDRDKLSRFQYYYVISTLIDDYVDGIFYDGNFNATTIDEFDMSDKDYESKSNDDIIDLWREKTYDDYQLITYNKDLNLGFNWNWWEIGKRIDKVLINNKNVDEL